MSNSAGNSEPRYPRNEGFVGGKAPGKAPRITEETAMPPVAVKKRNMVTRDAPTLFKFSSPGDFLSGELLFVEKIKIKDKTTGQPKFVMEYGVLSSEGKVSKFLGSYDLNAKLRPSDVGRFIEIALSSIDDSKNGMFVFDVQIEEKPSAPVADGMGITDEDIPF